jgi:glycosidase
VHRNYVSVNVEKQQAKSDSLWNVVRGLLNIRRQKKCLQEGRLALLENLPSGVLGFARIWGGKKAFVLLNFDDRSKEFRFESAEKLFSLTAGDAVENRTVRLAGFGGLLLTAKDSEDNSPG